VLLLCLESLIRLALACSADACLPDPELSSAKPLYLSSIATHITFGIILKRSYKDRAYQVVSQVLLTWILFTPSRHRCGHNPHDSSHRNLSPCHLHGACPTTLNDSMDVYNNSNKKEDRCR
jgi:hypothetical protein